MWPKRKKNRSSVENELEICNGQSTKYIFVDI
jgi:hypothetical protein